MKIKLGPETTIAIQGFGNVGSVVGEILGKEMNCKILGVSDTKGGVYNQEGIDPILLKKHEMGFPVTTPNVVSPTPIE